MTKKFQKPRFIVKTSMFTLSVMGLLSNALGGPLQSLGQNTGLSGTVKGVTGSDLSPTLNSLDNVFPEDAIKMAPLSEQQLSDILALDAPLTGNNGNDKPVGNAQKKAKHKSPIEPISAPLGRSLAPLIDAVDQGLDPLTNPVDDLLTSSIITIIAPLSDPLLGVIDPVSAPFDGVVSDLTSGSLEDAPTNNDYKPKDGNGVINDLLGNDHRAHRESGEASLVPIITRPLGKALNSIVSAVDEGLDPLTNVVDDQILEPILVAVAPLTEPLLLAIEPATDPLDGTLADLTGGSIEDALTNKDDNRADGNGVVNDLLGGDKNRNKPNNNGTFGNNGNDKPVGNAQGKPPKNKSPTEPVSAPLGRSLSSLIDTVDTSLDPITDPIDQLLFAPVLLSLTPVSGPVLEAIAPGTHPVDGVVFDISGGSIEDALADDDYNDTDGNGFFNDLFGHGKRRDGGDNAGEHSVIPTATRRWGRVADRSVSSADEGLDPLTDIIDDQILAPVLDAVAPGTEPVLAAIEPVTDPVDGTLADLTGGSVEDALTNKDDNRADGNGVVNDLLGGDKNRNKPNDNGTFGNNGNDKPVGNAQGKKPKNKSPIEPISAPLGRSLTPAIDSVDEALDPLSNPVD
ncbi:hypothetical protein AB4876_17400, partial [Zhongshania guokunii]